MELKNTIILLISFSIISFFGDCQDASPSPSPSPSPLPFSSISISPMQSSSMSPSPASSPSYYQYLPASEPPSALPLLFKPIPTPPRNPVLIKICETTDHPLECLTSIFPFQTGESDPVSVLKMEMQALYEGFEKALAYATEISKRPGTPEYTRSSLETCIEMYDSGLVDLQDAIDAISAHDINKLKTVLSATISDIEACEEAFIEESDNESPMKEYDYELSMIASNNLAIANALIH